MIEGLKPYSAYRRAPLRWLPSFPKHWDMQRGKNLFRESTLPVRDGDGVVTCFRDGQVTLRTNRRTSGFTNAILEGGYQGVREGQLVIHAMDAFAGAVGVSDSEGKCTPEYAVCDPITDANPHYYAWLLREAARLKYILIECPAVRERAPRFRYPMFGNMSFPVPPPDEQAAIVKFIDYADRRIRRYIRAKQKLIKLLEEQKQAIIHQAVTRGLDPNVRLKSSGVEWIDNLPAEWQLLQVRRLVTFVTSGSRGWARYYSEVGDVFLQSGNLGRTMSLNLARVQHVIPPESSEGTRTRVQKNDILVCITGALTGNTAIVDEELPDTAYVNQHVALVRPNPRLVLPRFLAYCLHSPLGQGQFKTSEYGGTKQGLGLDEVRQAWLPVPPAAEQVALVSHLDAALSRVRDGIDAAQREIDLLREYRTRLIADVVTGKLDVRQAAANLPDELDPDEPEIDEADDMEDADDIEAEEADE